jgi:CheY-like chemotaxis protein
LAGRHILLVEDDYFIAYDLATTFEAAGAKVVGPAASLSDALGLLARTDRLDGAVLDINLQGEMVYPLVDALKVRAVPIVFATGYDSGAIPTRYADITRCEKPLDYEKLVKLMFT